MTKATYHATVRLRRRDGAGNPHWEGGHRFFFDTQRDRDHFLTLVGHHPDMAQEEAGHGMTVSAHDAFVRCQRLVHEPTTSR